MEAFAVWKSIAGWASHQVRSEIEELRTLDGLPLA